MNPPQSDVILHPSLVQMQDLVFNKYLIII